MSAEVTPDDANAIRGVILSQMEAFVADDAERAFTFASPPIQTMFGTPEVFMDMVRLYYAAVYRPRGVRFGEAVRHGWGVDQVVALLLPEGDEVTARYQLALYDGRWRIDGCVLG